MDKANAIKRSFIKGSVNRKFGETAERLRNIARTISVFKVNEKTDTTEIESEVKRVMNRIDDLDRNINENIDKRSLNKLIKQPSRRKMRSHANEKGKEIIIVEESERVGAISQNNLGKAETLFQDAHWYLIGEGTRKDVERAIDLYEESAKLGNADAYLALGNIYEKGLGVRADLEAAADHYKMAAEYGKPLALYKIGQFIEKRVIQYNTKKESIEQMFENYTNAIEAGSVEAKIRIAQIYEKGEYGVVVDKKKALQLYQDAADHEEAMNSIGFFLYERGDLKRAADFFRKSADKGNATGLNNLGTWYELGKGVETNTAKAFELYEEAAK